MNVTSWLCFLFNKLVIARFLIIAVHNIIQCPGLSQFVTKMDVRDVKRWDGVLKGRITLPPLILTHPNQLKCHGKYDKM